ncbi:hypothetical protein [Cupriavidus lacunae]|uniref:Colicin transporter n=1 Tax=Cupriavidus lacunae TaxID=2666307 RepID=A0A370NZV1_9BURK|nr:hypothetical protein [Cupriavidus lacunae]RDK11058.1 hypothetical protein DN412_06695 [Cupriavidus lacunae]
MIVKSRPAAVQATLLAMPTFANVPESSLFRFGPLAALAVAACAVLVPLREAQAQASAPAAPPAASVAPGAQRDFAAERQAISDSRAWTNYRFAAAERECYGKFFVNHCIDKAKEAQREELLVLRKRELEVGEAERAHRAAERDREQALRRAEFEASQPQRAASEQTSREAFEKKQQEQQLRDAQRQGEAPQRAANTQAYEKKQSDYDARMQEAQQKGAEQARQRQENVKAYEAKQRDLEQRQKELEERRAKAKEQQGQASAPRPFGF